MSKRKISRCFQRETDKIIDKAEEKIENEFHEEESDARLPNLKPRNFQTKWFNVSLFSYFSDSKYQVTRRSDDDYDDDNRLSFFTYQVFIPPCTLEYGMYSIQLEVRVKDML